MALEVVSHYFDDYRQKGGNILNSIRENVAQSLKKSVLAKYSKFVEVPDDEFAGWLDTLFDPQGFNGLMEDQRCEIRRQFNVCLKKFDESSCIACWNYWLRSDLKPVSALLLVDIQNDFISGSLALKNCPAGEDGEEVVPIIQHLLSQSLFDVICYSYDWHPSKHCSFVDNVSLYPLHPTSQVSQGEARLFDVVIYDRMPLIPQILWPTHCVKNTWGAELHKDLKPPGNGDLIVNKGTDPLVDSYSAFQDNDNIRPTSLFVDLLEHKVTDVYVCGLALDVCVKATALDAVNQGFRAHVIIDACRGVTAEGIAEAKQTFMQNGITILASNEVKDAIRSRKQPSRSLGNCI